jgi:spectinomycin phosphotransferase
MLEKLDLPEERIVARLQDAYGLPVVHVVFLPLGADLNTAVYRAVSADGTAYFVKLRRGLFDETSVALPRFLRDQGVEQIIAPRATKTGQLHTTLEAFQVVAYPFVEGHNGYEVDLTDRQWRDFGAALRRIHSAQAPQALRRRIRQERYSPRWRASLRSIVGRLAVDAPRDPLAARLAEFVEARRGEILDLVRRAESLAQALEAQPPVPVLCHSDIHAGNVLVAEDGALYIVDWDSPILAPKERDLMYAGGGQMGNWRTPHEEETLFYDGYGPTQVDGTAMAYYRYERIVEDLSVECEHILSTDGGQDREQSFRWLTSNFLPGGVLEIARRSDDTPRRG